VWSASQGDGVFAVGRLGEARRVEEAARREPAAGVALVDAELGQHHARDHAGDGHVGGHHAVERAVLGDEVVAGGEVDEVRALEVRLEQHRDGVGGREVAAGRQREGLDDQVGEREVLAGLVDASLGGREEGLRDAPAPAVAGGEHRRLVARQLAALDGHGQQRRGGVERAHEEAHRGGEVLLPALVLLGGDAVQRGAVDEEEPALRAGAVEGVAAGAEGAQRAHRAAEVRFGDGEVVGQRAAHLLEDVRVGARDALVGEEGVALAGGAPEPLEQGDGLEAVDERGVDLERRGARLRGGGGDVVDGVGRRGRRLRGVERGGLRGEVGVAEELAHRQPHEVLADAHVRDHPGLHVLGARAVFGRQLERAPDAADGGHAVGVGVVVRAHRAARRDLLPAGLRVDVLRRQRGSGAHGAGLYESAVPLYSRARPDRGTMARWKYG
jgi:hypothetical protein